MRVSLRGDASHPSPGAPSSPFPSLPASSRAPVLPHHRRLYPHPHARIPPPCAGYLWASRFAAPSLVALRHAPPRHPKLGEPRPRAKFRGGSEREVHGTPPSLPSLCRDERSTWRAKRGPTPMTAKQGSSAGLVSRARAFHRLAQHLLRLRPRPHASTRYHPRRVSGEFLDTLRESQNLGGLRLQVLHRLPRPRQRGGVEARRDGRQALPPGHGAPRSLGVLAAAVGDAVAHTRLARPGVGRGPR